MVGSIKKKNNNNNKNESWPAEVIAGYDNGGGSPICLGLTVALPCVQYIIIYIPIST